MSFTSKEFPGRIFSSFDEYTACLIEQQSIRQELSKPAALIVEVEIEHGQQTTAEDIQVAGKKYT